MSGRGQTLMRTRCPACDTVFRVTSEQLRLKAGKVRCGHCQHVFNAFDQLVPDADPVADLPLLADSLAQPEPATHDPAAPAPESPTVDVLVAPESVPPVEDAVVAPAESQHNDSVAPTRAAASDFVPFMGDASAAAVQRDARDHAPAPMVSSIEETVEPGAEAADDVDAESVAASTQAAREAGLVAARELIDTQAYNRWAAGTLAESGLSGFAAEQHERPMWPYVLVLISLVLMLMAQLGYHYRTELSRKFPALSELYAALSISVPLSRLSESVSIETSDLQADNARGLFVLQAALHNRAAFAQDWPVLELTLTDVNDRVVSRRLLNPIDYLPPGTDATAFPANGELGIRLWLEAQGLGAAGYRLYVFYP